MLLKKCFVGATALTFVAVLFAPVRLWAQQPSQTAPSTVDLRYAPVWWQTAICLPDDWQKSLVGKEGALLYDFGGRPAGFKTRIAFDVEPAAKWIRQELVGPRIAIVRTVKRSGDVEIQEEAFAVAPALARAQRDSVSGAANPPRHDLVLVRLRNRGLAEAVVRPVLSIDSEFPVKLDASGRIVRIGEATALVSPQPLRLEKQTKTTTAIRWAGEFRLAAAEEKLLAFGVIHARDAASPEQFYPKSADQARDLRNITQQYWESADLPYGCFEVPDVGIQAQLDSAIRNIYQAREIRGGLPVFQVGPTCYRGLWVVDGSFLMEAVTYLGRIDEARAGIRYLLNFQRPDGSFMLLPGHLKETGIVLWAVTRHARLTGDKAWLIEIWPRVEKGFEYIRTMRRAASANPKAPNYRLLPEGFSDGGLGGINPEYTNVYWTLSGMKAAVDAARWLGKSGQAAAWQKEYDDFYAAFRHAAQRDTRIDAYGNSYVPISMRKHVNLSPQKAQWAFLHAVFPGKLFAATDPLVLGNMAMLRAAETEGLVRDTGWVANGVWTYFASFYAHGWLWIGQGQKAAQALYDFANHASPLMVWREEQMPVGEGDKVVGDMPHNWASAEFIRLVRHLLILERGDELHLFEGLPTAWVGPGKSIRVRNAVTEFGPMSLEFRVAADGSRATLVIDPPHRDRFRRIVVHQSAWNQGAKALEITSEGRTEMTILLKPR